MCAMDTCQRCITMQISCIRALPQIKPGNMSTDDDDKSATQTRAQNYPQHQSYIIFTEVCNK